jgi:hypothetical protein
MNEDPRKTSREEVVNPNEPLSVNVPARGMSDDLVDGETVDLPEKNIKASEDSVVRNDEAVTDEELGHDRGQS